MIIPIRDYIQLGFFQKLGGLILRKLQLQLGVLYAEIYRKWSVIKAEGGNSQIIDLLALQIGGGKNAIAPSLAKGNGEVVHVRCDVGINCFYYLEYE